MNNCLVVLKSDYADRYDNTLNSHCHFRLPIIELDSNFQILISISNASIPYSWYNVNTYNNVLRVDFSNDTNISYTFSTGNYNTRTLVSYLSTLMTDFTITYNKLTNKMLFTHSSLNFTFNNTYSTCFELLGFKRTFSPTSNTLALTSNICCNLNGTRNVNIYCNYQSDNILHADKLDRTFLGSILVNTTPTGVITYENPNNLNKINTLINNLNKINLELCDDKGRPLDLNGVDWSLGLLLEYYDFVDNTD